VMGQRSISPYQAVARDGHLEKRLQLTARSVMDDQPAAVAPTTSLHEVFWDHLVRGRRHTAFVVDDGRFLGMVSSTAIDEIPREDWETTEVGALTLSAEPVATPSTPVTEVLYDLEHGDTDRIPICEEGLLIGVITRERVLALSELLDDGDR
jgi:CBS domain-containing protein